MALESLAPDQRAVVELVLRQDRSYAELAGLLDLSADAVRRRAHDGLRTLGPDNGLDAQQRGRVSDYLLGQLADDERTTTMAWLSDDPRARAWARTVAGELAPVATRPLPEVPAGADPHSGSDRAPAGAPSGARAAARPAPPKASRLGGAMLIGVCTVALATLVVWLLGRDDDSPSAKARAQATATATPTPGAQPLAEVALRPVGASKARGTMQVNVAQNGEVGILVLADRVEPSRPGAAYAVWLTDARRKPLRLGFEAKASGERSPSGSLAVAGPSTEIAPATFARALTRYDQLVVSLETSDRTTSPGPVVLRGSLKKLQGED